MDCVEFDNKINAYLHDMLNDDELNEFLLHLNSCEKCREELEVNYIINEGIRRLDRDRADYNLSAAYKESIKESGRYMRRRKGMIRTAYVADTLIFWAVLMAAFVFLRTLFLGS